MDHLAIMNPKWHLIEKILAGEKTIESRWYAHKIAPWNKITVGDTVYFKNSGKMVTAKATVQKFIQQELTSRNTAEELVRTYAEQICFNSESLINLSWLEKKRYAMLIFISNPELVTPFAINKTGFGSACAWISIKSIKPLTIISS